MTDKCIVMTTTENKEQSSVLIEKVLEEKLAACIQTNEIESHYVWQGSVCHDNEILIIFKTQKKLFKQLEKILKENHPYETPEIVCVPIDETSKEYGEWMNQVLK